MPKYKVELQYRNPAVVVEADNESDAMEIAQELIDDQTDFNAYDYSSGEVVEIESDGLHIRLNEVEQ